VYSRGYRRWRTTLEVLGAVISTLAVVIALWRGHPWIAVVVILLAVILLLDAGAFSLWKELDVGRGSIPDRLEVLADEADMLGRRAEKAGDPGEPSPQQVLGAARNLDARIVAALLDAPSHFHESFGTEGMLSNQVFEFQFADTQTYLASCIKKMASAVRTISSLIRERERGSLGRSAAQDEALRLSYGADHVAFLIPEHRTVPTQIWQAELEAFARSALFPEDEKELLDADSTMDIRDVHARIAARTIAVRPAYSLPGSPNERI
jgi:hypothetical protein